MKKKIFGSLLICGVFFSSASLTLQQPYVKLNAKEAFFCLRGRESFAVPWTNYRTLMKDGYITAVPLSFFITPAKGWVIDYERCYLLQTTDSGRTCTPFLDLEKDERDRRVRAGWRSLDEKEAVLLFDVYESNKLLAYYRGRRDLVELPRSNPAQRLIHFRSTMENTELWCTYGGPKWEKMVIWHTVDGGFTWVSANIPPQLSNWRTQADLYIKEKNNMLIIIDKHNEVLPYNFVSLDKGKTWLERLD